MTFVPGPTLIAAWLIVTANVAVYASAILRPPTISRWIGLAAAIWLPLQAAVIGLLAIT